jgi:hypothetical protein
LPRPFVVLVACYIVLCVRPNLVVAVNRKPGPLSVASSMRLLRNWWTPAMDAICEFVGMSEHDHYDLCDRYSRYVQGERRF